MYPTELNWQLALIYLRSPLLRLTCVVLLLTGVSFAQTRNDEVIVHAGRAKKAQTDGDYKTAIAEYRQLEKLVPGNPQLETNLGIVLYLDNQLEAAVVPLQSAIQRAPHLFSPRLFAGIALARMGRSDQAEAQLAEASRINPADYLPHLWLGFIYAAQEKYASAVAKLRTALLVQPANADALYTLGKAYLDWGQQEIKQLLVEAPDGGRAWQLAGEQCRLRGENELALKFFRGAAKRRPDVVGIPLTLQALSRNEPLSQSATSNDQSSPAHREDQRYAKIRDCQKQAEEIFATLGRVAADSDRTLQVEADSLDAQGRDDEAIRAYRAVLDKNNRLPEVFAALGSIYLRKGKTADAIAAFEKALELQPQSAVANVRLARALLANGDDNRGQQLLQSASQMEHPPIALYKLQGKLFLRDRQYAKAATALEQYSKQVPLDSSAHYLLTRVYRAQGNANGAEREAALYRKSSIDAKTRLAAARTLAQRDGEPREGTDEEPGKN